MDVQYFLIRDINTNYSLRAKNRMPLSHPVLLFAGNRQDIDSKFEAGEDSLKSKPSAIYSWNPSVTLVLTH